VVPSLGPCGNLFGLAVAFYPGERNHLLSLSTKESIELLNQASSDRRRGKRLFLNFSVEIAGFDEKGRSFVERTKTEDISEFGCRLNTSFHMKCGDQVQIKLIAPQGAKFPEEPAQQFEVMRVDKEKSGWSIGARKSTNEKLWKVTFPPPKSSPEPRSK
jgi:hypothetical protein